MINLVRNDNGSQVEAVIARDNTGLPVDLTNAIVKMRVRKKGSDVVLFTLTALTDQSIDLESGIAIFAFSSSNLSIDAGRYEGEVEVLFPNQDIETVFEVIDFIIRDDF